jgi:methyltransferase (TIGR00027 family)
MNDPRGPTPAADPTAVRTALWRAMHVQVDAPPHVLEDDVGLKLVAPDEAWRARPDMDAQGTRPFRASIVARARFIEDLLVEEVGRGVDQYVLLGAGLDTFAQRRPELASRGLRVFEIDRPGPQEWKRRRLVELGFGVPDWLRFVPVDLEAGAPWPERLAAEGFDVARPAVVASTGVSMYLTREANVDTLRQLARLAAGSTLAMSFLLPFERAEPDARQGIEASARGARASGTPFISFFDPAELVDLARAAGFREARHVSAAALGDRYFAERTDGLRPPLNGEELLVSTT